MATPTVTISWIPAAGKLAIDTHGGSVADPVTLHGMFRLAMLAIREQGVEELNPDDTLEQDPEIGKERLLTVTYDDGKLSVVSHGPGLIDPIEAIGMLSYALEVAQVNAEMARWRRAMTSPQGQRARVLYGPDGSVIGNGG